MSDACGSAVRRTNQQVQSGRYLIVKISPRILCSITGSLEDVRSLWPHRLDVHERLVGGHVVKLGGLRNMSCSDCRIHRIDIDCGFGPDFVKEIAHYVIL